MGVTSGFEGPWTSNPLKWSNQFFKDLLNKEWVVHKGPGGHWQWKNTDDDGLIRLTSDIDYFNLVFSQAWFKLTTNGGSWADNAKCDDGKPFPAELRHVSKYEHSDGFMLNNDMSTPAETANQVFV